MSEKPNFKKSTDFGDIALIIIGAFVACWVF